MCWKQRGATQPPFLSYCCIIWLSRTQELHSRARSSGKMLERGPVRLQPGREAVPHAWHRARGAGCQPGTVKTTLKLSLHLVFFFCPPFMSEDVLTPKAFMVALVIE